MDLTNAMSLAWYIIPSSCLYADSCSSSTTIKPKSEKGKKSDDRAPIIIFILLERTPSQTLFLCLMDIPECHSATNSPKLFLNLIKNSDVRAISGSNTRACLFSNKNPSIAFIYTSVFPEPVTPSRTTV